MSTTSARPAAGVDSRQLRTAIGHFATGVTVVTAIDDEGRSFGSTANAVSSVSLNPPLVLVCLRDESETLSAILGTRRFAINMLREDQRHLAERFARTASRDTWTGVAHVPAPITGAALIDGALATLECELHSIADGGDHTIAVGQVLAVEHPAEHVPPLLFYRGAFASAASPPAPLETVRVNLPSEFGDLRLIALDLEPERSTGVIALVGEPEGVEGAEVYVHEGCVLGDALGHTGCAGHGRLQAVLDRMRGNTGPGVVVYRRSAGFGACCLGSGSSLPPGPSPLVRRALDELRLRRVRLLAGPEGEHIAHGLGLDVAEVVELEAGA
jgi:flavin reductase (DIM6/NTAB) family NADH-FMN oxidoreductase RutF